MLAVLAGALAWNWEEISRLRAVNSMFDADRIVANFSNMDDLLLTRDVAVGELGDMAVDLRDLPETVAIAGEARSLDALLDETDTTSLLVMVDGVIVHEDYRLGTGAEDQRISWSVAKSFLSALVGRAVVAGDIASLDDDVTAYVPELVGTAYEGASVRNVLNMASGVRFNEDYFDRDSDINRMGRTLALGGSLDDFSEGLVEREFAPGSANQYVSIDTHVIGRVLRAATGRTVYDLFEEAFAPVGLGPVTYITDGDGEAFVLGGLLMTTRGYAKFGQLFAQGGQWEGETVIPADWVAESTAISAPPVHGEDTRGRAYGYQWWMLPDANGVGDYFANGIYGQTIYVNPERNVVIVKTSADREFSGLGESGLPTQVEVVLAMRSVAEAMGRTSP
ncbi:MAG: serine hydrolase [Litorimonas sp.]